jgi:hypothetical protein
MTTVGHPPQLPSLLHGDAATHEGRGRNAPGSSLGSSVGRQAVKPHAFRHNVADPPHQS